MFQRANRFTEQIHVICFHIFSLFVVLGLSVSRTRKVSKPKHHTAIRKEE